MTNLPVSVVVVSRDRPAALQRCLTGISQLQYDPFEVIVVADPAGIAAAEKLSFAAHLKLVTFDAPNISAARNLGIGQAAGDIVAFIDDDSVPEPQWLRLLTAPASQTDVAAMGGFVRGRNGISYQWRAQSVDEFGDSHPLDVNLSRATVLHPPKGRAVKTEGTNMAFRRSVLVDLGGFDTAFHYFLEDTDLNLRLAQAGHATALVPLAEVHHGYAANAVRTTARVPKDLFEIGASWAVFHAKHVAPGTRADRWKQIEGGQKRRLLHHMIAGRLEPRDVRRLLRRLREGYAAGGVRKRLSDQLARHPAAPFNPFPARARRAVFLSSRPWRLQKDLAVARERVKGGNEVATVICLSPTALFHRLTFDAGGVWVQRGGTFGKSDRSEPIFRMTTRSRRIEKETARVARVRGLREE